MYFGTEIYWSLNANTTRITFWKIMWALAGSFYSLAMIERNVFIANAYHGFRQVVADKVEKVSEIFYSNIFLRFFVSFFVGRRCVKHPRRSCKIFTANTLGGDKITISLPTTFSNSFFTGVNRTMVAAATIVGMAAAKKAQQNVFALYHSHNHTILLRFMWILDFHFKIVLVLRRRYLIPIRCNNGKRKMWPWRWLHHFDFQHWRWLHALMTMVALFRAGNFWHTHSPLQTNMLIGCMIVVKCDTCKISGAYAHLDSITSTVVILVIGIACRSLILI